MKSIKLFLLIVIISVITLLVFLATLNGYRDSMNKAELLFDSNLVDKAKLLSTVLLKKDLSNKVAAGSKKYNLEQNNTFVFQIWQSEQLILSSNDSPDMPIGRFKAGFQHANFAGHRWRVYCDYNLNINVWTFTAERIDIRYILAETIILEIILPVVIMLPFLGLLIWTIISYGLYPLKQLSQTLSQKRADDLSPLALEKHPGELLQLVNSINGLFHRLQDSFLREKRFASDAAHELRTPISAIKVHLHNLSTLVDSDNHSLIQLKSSVDRMGYLIEQILNLNRTSNEQYSTQFSSIDIYQLTQRVIARDYHHFEQKKQQIELLGTQCLINGDPFSLDILIQNLLSNANKYTPENGHIEVSLVNKEDYICLQVQDSGPGVSKVYYERLFDRFYRLNGDRNNSGITGCGLGLAIVKQIADLHQAEIKVGPSKYPTGLKLSILFIKQGVL